MPTEVTADDGAVGIEGALALLPVSRSLLYQLIASGELPSFELHRRRLISRRAIRAFIANREAVAATERGDV